MTNEDWTYENFAPEEFECPCCGAVQHQHASLALLQKARTLAGVAFPISEGGGYRCAEYNAAIGGAPNSAHTRGYAYDITCSEEGRRFLILSSLLQVGFTRIGVYNLHIHADGDPSLRPYIVWTGKSK